MDSQKYLNIKREVGMDIKGQFTNGLSSFMENSALNHYILSIDSVDASAEISVLSIEGKEELNQPWRYTINFNSPNKHIAIDSVLSQPASLTFQSANLIEQLIEISGLIDKPRTLYGIITEFSLISMSQEQAQYRVVLEPRVALLSNHHQSAIFQNQSVVEVVEEVLRNHGFTGIDFRFELKESYPIREFITQWQESDLAFIKRLMSDVGIWFYFDTHREHNCDVMVISDYEQGFQDAGNIIIKQPSGLNDNLKYSVWNLQFRSKTQPNQVSVNDYNYRMANNSLFGSANSQVEDITTRGEDYRYEEHHKTLGDELTVESGMWYAHIRHQHYIAEQLIISGECNNYQLIPGQHIIIDECPIKDMDEGIIILSTQTLGSRAEPFRMHFTAIAYAALKPYRPAPLPWPQVSGTLPARVTSPDNDTYGYIDTQGRYRIKFNFDLKNWKKGEESLWVRLAKPYSGDTYGFHFPLIDGTEVAIGFTNGNPDRPYIAHAMHDSTHPDHVATANKHRNVIRTPANNKLRMDDKRGQEHIKLATEYGKTQLNLGHLVDSEKTKRGEGFELRTDEWGAISAEKGLYITTETKPNATAKQLDMDGASAQLNNAFSIAESLQQAVQASKAHAAELESQSELKNTLTQLNQSGIMGYAKEGIGLTSPKNIQLSTSKNVSIIAEDNTDISVLKKITLAAGGALSFFAHKMGIKLFASKGKVEIEAQNDEMAITAKNEIQISSIDDSVILTAQRDITLISGGSYIKINSNGIELGTKGNILLKSGLFQKMGPASININTQETHFADIPQTSLCVECLRRAARLGEVMLEIE